MRTSRCGGNNKEARLLATGNYCCTSVTNRFDGGPSAFGREFYFDAEKRCFVFFLQLFLRESLEITSYLPRDFFYFFSRRHHIRADASGMKGPSYLATKLGQRGQNHRVRIGLLVTTVKRGLAEHPLRWCQERLCLLCLRLACSPKKILRATLAASRCLGLHIHSPRRRAPATTRPKRTPPCAAHVQLL